MSKTFSNEGRDLIIEKCDFGGVKFRVESNGRHANGAIASVADAPAIALAILEAAGIEAIPFDEGPETIPGHAVWALRHHVQELEAKAKAAADWEALEGEALDLLNAWRIENEQKRVASFDEDGGNFKEAWIGVARAARAVREMTGVKA